MKNKLITGISLGLLVGILLLICNLPLKNDKNTSETQIEGQITSETTTSSTTSTTTTTTAKTTVKTTQKTTKKKTNYNFKKVETASKQEYMEYARQISGYNDTQMQCLDYLWSHESGWNPNNYNEYTDCCGIPQSHPCNKIIKQQGSYDWRAQIRWGINYITYKYYGNPCSAWNHYKNQGGY